MRGTISDETCDVNRRLEAISVLHPSLDPHNCRAITTMRIEEKAFLRAAVTALPRIAEIISGYAPDGRAGALEVAERGFIEAARDYGCTEVAAQSRVSILMKRLRRQLERQGESEEQLRALLRSITKSD